MPARTVGEFAGSIDATSSPKHFRQTEIEDLQPAVASELNVGWLEIPMNDALLVRCLQGLRDLPGDPERFLNRQRATHHPIGEGFALHQFHNEKVAPGALLEIVNGGDVAVAQ